MKQSFSKNIRSLQQFANEGLITPEACEKLAPVEEHFSSAITRSMIDVIDRNDPEDPIARQFIPTKEELTFTEGERTDPIGDQLHMPVKGIIHRHKDRCLLMPIAVCPVYCRFCFRREKVGSAQHGLNQEELDCALDYIKEHEEIWEVILSGGDPLFMPVPRLREILRQLASIPHVEVLRIHTRVPIVLPHRIDEAMVEAMRGDKPLYVILHTNHAKELTKEATLACARLVDRGVPLLSQTVLLKGVNDTAKAMGDLLRTLVRHRIKPYYLHHGDMARGTDHFRTTIGEGQELMRQLRRELSGLCLPTYVLDIPGGYGKVPIHHSYLHMDEIGHYIVEDIHGAFHPYPPSDHSTI